MHLKYDDSAYDNRGGKHFGPSVPLATPSLYRCLTLCDLVGLCLLPLGMYGQTSLRLEQYKFTCYQEPPLGLLNTIRMLTF